jgi:acyl CoA:acetate/3-ketoacid CoA transferase beta subunit
MRDMNAAFADTEKLDAWINEWIIDCPTHEHYLRKLGSQRINALRGMMTRDLWNYDFSFAESPIKTNQDYTQEEMVPIVAAREIIKSVQKFQHKTMLVGVGTGLLAAWLAYYQLRASGYEIELIQGNGQIGYLPQPAESLLRSGALAPSAKMMTDAITTHGVFVGGKNNKCLSLLGTGEIDKYGNINSTRTSAGQFLSGSGGANDAANAQEVMVVIEQSKRRFVEKLPFITCPGNRITTVVSSMGVFRKSIGKDELSLTACLPDPALANIEAQIAQIQANCGWTLKLASKVEKIPKPDPSELQLLRSLLPPTLT